MDPISENGAYRVVRSGFAAEVLNIHFMHVSPNVFLYGFDVSTYNIIIE